MDEGPSPEDKKIDLHISSPFAVLLVRFPIADLRPEQNRRPWWQRELRKDVLILECTELFIQTVIGGDEGQLKLEFTSKEVHGKHLGQGLRVLHVKSKQLDKY